MADYAQQGVSSSVSFNPTAGFIVANEPTSAQMSTDTIFYYGFVSHDGGWYIQRRDTDTGENKFAKGFGGYTTNWSNRLSQTYEFFHITFRSGAI